MKSLADGRGRTTLRRIALWIGVCSFSVLSCLAGPLGEMSDDPAVAGARHGGARIAVAAHPVPGTLLFEGHTVGDPIIIDNLAVFPVYANEQEDIGEVVTLDDALEAGTAIVREIGAESAQVNTLVIENRGAVAILVLAGTIVKGGKQDRQIGQDFLIGAKESQPVDAFCIEHGRWNGEREGAATDGKFKTMKVLAVGDVRAAGQYEQNQSMVWDKVGEVNKATGKKTASDTLVASVEDAALIERRQSLARRALDFLATVPQAPDVVGLAYAVDGKVRGVRSFLNRRLFVEYSEVLANTAATEALTAQAQAKSAGQARRDGASKPADVVAFVQSVANGKKEERDTQAQNKNAYTFDDDGYSTEMYMKAAPAADSTAPAAAPKKPVTRDFLSK